MKSQYQLDQELLTAVTKGDLKAAQTALAEGANLNAQSNQRNNMAYIAATRGYEDVFDWLLQAKNADGSKMDLNTKNSSDNTALYEMIKDGTDIKFVEKMLQAGANPNALCGEYQSPALNLACSSSNSAAVKVLLECGADPNIKSEWTGVSPLFMAVTNCDLETVKMVVDAGADTREVNKIGENILAAYLSILYTHKRATDKKENIQKIADYLLSLDMDFDAVSSAGLTSIHHAQQMNREDLCLKLVPKTSIQNLSRIFSYTRNSIEGTTLLHEAVRRNEEELSQALLKRGVSLDVKDAIGNPAWALGLILSGTSKQMLKKGYSPDTLLKVKSHLKELPAVSVAAKNSQTDAVKALIKAGARLDFPERDSVWSQPFFLAIRAGDLDSVKAIFKSGQIDINKPYKRDTGVDAEITPLMWAAYQKHEEPAITKEIIKYLVKNGANVKALDHDGRNAAFFAQTEAALEALDKAGVDLLHTDKYGDTPLLFALKNSTEEATEYLVNKHKDSPEHKKVIDSVCYQTAFVSDDFKPVAIVGLDNFSKALGLKKGDPFPGINYQDEDGNSALLVASASGAGWLAKIFIERGADVNLANNNGETPLMHAISTQNYLLAKDLIKAGADIRAKTNGGMSVEDFVKEANNYRVTVVWEEAEAELKKAKKSKKMGM